MINCSCKVSLVAIISMLTDAVILCYAGVEQSKVVNRPFWELFKPLRESKAFIEMRAAHSMPELASFNATIKYGEIELKLQFR